MGRVIETVASRPSFQPTPAVIKNPFLHKEIFGPERDEWLHEIINIQTYGLAGRLKAVRANGVVLGLSGGLDSTLALLVACRTAKILGKTKHDIVTTVTMPGMASSNRTQDNAQKLAALLGVSNRVIPIEHMATEQLVGIGHDATTQDITYENTQARIRTSLLFNEANQSGRIVLGTGNLSELALGWCTFGGDHLSHYNVNGGIPKTLVRLLVEYLREDADFEPAKAIIDDILATPVSPELVSANHDHIIQKTDDIIGPVDLRDFILYHLVRWGESRNKISFLAQHAFRDDYGEEEIEKWLDIFLDRFPKNQFKRSVMPDSPKALDISFSPRSTWRMPSDMSNALWN